MLQGVFEEGRETDNKQAYKGINIVTIESCWRQYVRILFLDHY